MGDRRFDRAARALAYHRSRRGLVGGLIGGGVALLMAHLRLPGVAARQGYSVQGEACVDDDQCIWGDTPLVCAYNGFGSAGAACCAGIGGSCADEYGCCGPNICYLGTCITSYIPGAGETCWALPSDPDPCDETSVCIHDWQSGSVWGTCQSIYTGGVDSGSNDRILCMWYRDPECRASCPLLDPCGPGLRCTGTSEDVGTCVPA
jgi:hypothetical protein